LQIVVALREVVEVPGPVSSLCQGLVTMVNGIYNGYRMEDVWLDK